MSIGDIDLVEINEAFAAQVVPSYQDLGIDLDRLNVNGGAIAVGHPFGMTGARLQNTMLNSLDWHDKTTGLITMCVGGGQGMALILERLGLTRAAPDRRRVAALLARVAPMTEARADPLARRRTSSARGAPWSMGITLLLDRLDDDLRRAFDLSLTEYEILVRLSERDGRQMRMAQLADALAHSRSRVTHTVARMEQAGLVARCTLARGRPRHRRARMTDEGYDLLVRVGAGARQRRPRPPRRPGQPPRTSPRSGRVMNASPTTWSPPTPRWRSARLSRTAARRSARRGRGSTSRGASVAGEAAVGDPVRARRLDAEPLDLVLLVGGEVALEPEPLGGVLVVALPGEDVGGDAVEEPPVVGGDHGTAGELQQRVLERRTGSRRRGRWWARRAAAGCRPSSASARG